MAEAVHKRLEETLPELEELERIGIFNRQEIKEVVRKRQKFEYRMLRRPSKKEDFVQAIQFELDLEQRVKRRKKKYGIVTTKQSDSSYGFTSRVHGLFQRVLHKFKGDVGLWAQYAHFCQRVRHQFALSKALGKALALNPHCHQLWVLAAKTELEGNRNTQAARSLLQRALRSNEDCPHLWTEVFRLELLHVDKLRRRGDVLGIPLDGQAGEESIAVSDQFMSYQSARLVYQASIKAIPDCVEFRLQLVTILDDFQEVEALLQEILSSLTRDFPNSAKAWDAVARQPVRKLDLSQCSRHDKVLLGDSVKGLYSRGLDTMSESRGELWRLYIQWFAEWLTRAEDLQRSKKVTELCRTSLADPQATELLAEFTVKQILSVNAKQETVEEFCCLATTKFPHSSALWGLRLSVTSGVVVKEKVFCDAVELVPGCVAVWEQWLEWSLVRGRDSRAIQKIFEKALVCGVPSVTLAMTLHLIEWTVMHHGVQATRKVYRKILASRPVPLEVYKKCITIEQAQEPRDVKSLRRLYEASLMEHGSREPDLWIAYLQAELSFGPEGATKVSQIHWRARKGLEGGLVETFIAQYSLIKLK